MITYENSCTSSLEPDTENERQILVKILEYGLNLSIQKLTMCMTYAQILHSSMNDFFNFVKYFLRARAMVMMMMTSIL